MATRMGQHTNFPLSAIWTRLARYPRTNGSFDQLWQWRFRVTTKAESLVPMNAIADFSSGLVLIK